MLLIFGTNIPNNKEVKQINAVLKTCFFVPF